MKQSEAYLKLHFIILLNGLSAPIIKLIELSSLEIVFLRTLIAFLVLAFLIKRQKLPFFYSWKENLTLFASGLLLASFWILNTITIKISTASVGIVAMATTSLWVTFIEPIMTGKKSKPFQLLVGINAIFGVYIIYGSDFEYGQGLALGLIGALCAAALTILSSKLSQKYHPYSITFYQFVGAWVGTVLFIPVYEVYFSTEELLLAIGWKDFFLIIVLALVISVYAYSVLIHVMKQIPPFAVALTNNLVPIYGIILAILLLGENEYMNFGFYIGAGLLLISVFAYPILTRYMERYQKEQDTKNESQEE